MPLSFDRNSVYFVLLKLFEILKVCKNYQLSPKLLREIKLIIVEIIKKSNNII